MRIVVTAGYNQSLHAVAIIHRLAERGHQVVTCFNVRTVSYSRLRTYLRQLGWRTLWNTMTKRILASGSDVPMVQYLKDHQITSRTVAQACQRVGARHLKVPSLNSPKTIAAFREANADLAVYAGGGILRQAFLEVPRLGALNAHGGPLPQFRGMHVVYWPLVYGVYPAITVHFVDRGIDTGPVILQRPIKVNTWFDVFTEHGLSTCCGVDAMLEAVDEVAGGRTQGTPQEASAGQQFFVMAEPLHEVVKRWIGEGRTPVRDVQGFRFPSPA